MTRKRVTGRENCKDDWVYIEEIEEKCYSQGFEEERGYKAFFGGKFSNMGIVGRGQARLEEGSVRTVQCFDVTSK